MAKVINTKPKRNWIKQSLLVVAYLVPLVGLAVFGGVYYKKYQDLQHKSPDQLAQTQVDQTLSDIDKLYSLPKDEKPVVATVKDKAAYKKQYPNFGDAENGDVLVVYTKAKLAILYRPTEKRLIKVGPVSVDSTTTGPVIKVIGKETDRAQAVKTLTDKKLSASDGGDAKAQYTATTVVDLSGKNGDQAQAVATAIGGQVGQLPEGEDKPAGVDILVITGSPAIP